MNDTTNQDSTLRRHWLTLAAGQQRGVLLLLGLVLLVVVLAMLGESGREQLRYERPAILDQHQYWRLLTAHLVHGGWQHTWLNLAGLALIVGLFHGTYSTLQWLVIALLSTLSIDLGMLVLMPQLQWYVGLSGVLHGLLTAGAVAWWQVEDRRLAGILSAILVAKLCWEQWHGALPFSGTLTVIVNAHLYGAIGGLLAGLLFIKRLLPAQNQ